MSSYRSAEEDALREAGRINYQAKRSGSDLAALKALLQEDEANLRRGVFTGTEELRVHRRVDELRQRVQVLEQLARTATNDEALLGCSAAVAAIEQSETLRGSDLKAVALDRYSRPEVDGPGHKLHRTEQQSSQPAAASEVTVEKLAVVGDQPHGRRETNFIITETEINNAAATAASAPKERRQSDVFEARAELAMARRMQIDNQRQGLPVTKAKGEILAAVAAHQVTVVIGETGSGKTTQIPQFLLEAGYSRVACTQPRRLAAMSVAERVATEMNVRLGRTVGYRVRFDDKTSDATEIEFVTDGMMIKTLAGDTQLSAYKAVMIDEAHERSLATDILLGFLRDLLRSRKDLRLIIASATIQATKFIDFFGGPRSVPLVHVSGRSFPVENFYLPEPREDYVVEAAKLAFQTHMDEPLPGDILVFMPGVDDIQACVAKLEEVMHHMPSGTVRPLLLLPLYSTLPMEEQRRIYTPAAPGTRKIIIATNIAETSITIDGVAFVIDTGLCKQKYYDTRSNMECLSIVPISRASAEQRRGRAGRTQAGKCLRLYTKHMYENELEKDPVPEILRSSLTAVLLSLKYIGIDNPLQFDFVDPPSPDALIKALSQLRILGALTDRGSVSRTGRQMAELPVEPSLARVLIKAQTVYGCCKEACIAVAVLSQQNSIFLSNADKQGIVNATKRQFFYGTTGDVVGYVMVFDEWERSQRYEKRWCESNGLNYNAMLRVRDVRNQLLNAMENMFPTGLTSCRDDPLVMSEALTKALLSGCFQNVAKLALDDRTFVVPRSNTEAFVFPGSAIAPLMRGPSVTTGDPGAGAPRFMNVPAGSKPRLVMFCELRQLRDRPYMVHVSVITPQWVRDVVPNYYKDEELCSELSTESKAGAKAMRPPQREP